MPLKQFFLLQRDLKKVHQLNSIEVADIAPYTTDRYGSQLCACPSDHAGMHKPILFMRLPMLQRLLSVLVYQLNDDEAADDDNFGEEDHVSSFRQAFGCPATPA